MEIKKLEITKKDVIESPKEIILDGVITGINKTKWENILTEEQLTRFENKDQDIIVISYEVSFNNSQVKGKDTFVYYEAPNSNSKLGKFLTRYEELKVGGKIRVFFNVKGHSNIVID